MDGWIDGYTYSRVHGKKRIAVVRKQVESGVGGNGFGWLVVNESNVAITCN